MKFEENEGRAPTSISKTHDFFSRRAMTDSKWQIYSISRRRGGGLTSEADDDWLFRWNGGHDRNDRRQSVGGVGIAVRVLVRDSRESLRVALLLQTLIETPAFQDFTRRSGIASKLSDTLLTNAPKAFNGDAVLLNADTAATTAGSAAGGAGGGNQGIVQAASGIVLSDELAIGLGVGLGTFFLFSCAAAAMITNRNRLRRYLSSQREREETHVKMLESVQVLFPRLSHAPLATTLSAAATRSIHAPFSAPLPAPSVATRSACASTA